MPIPQVVKKRLIDTPWKNKENGTAEGLKDFHAKGMACVERRRFPMMKSHVSNKKARRHGLMARITIFKDLPTSPPIAKRSTAARLGAPAPEVSAYGFK